MGKVRHIVKEVKKASIAEEMGITTGDEVSSVNGKSIEDIFDYHFLVNDEFLEVIIKKPDAEEWILEIEKEEDEELGIVFENEFMDDYRACQNKCIFCFIDQLPKGMRETLYFKDDDSRLSFLQGNYISMTNMKDEDLDRIIKFHLSPINISVHATNPKVRKEMLSNKSAGDILDKIQRLYEANIEMNGQIVLCKGVNDGDELERTINELKEYLPFFKSLSVVPVGLTRYRQGLYPLDTFKAEEALKVVRQIEKWQQQLLEKYQTRFVYCSDEWYILAGLDIPAEAEYEEYPQLENGVGMLRLLSSEVDKELANCKGDEQVREISVATGKLAYQFIEKYITMINDKYPQTTVHVYPIENHFFGEQITVSGLLTGRDIIEQLKGEKLGDCLILPINMLRAGEQVFLDDVTVTEVSKELKVPIRIVAEDGADFVASVLLEAESLGHKRRQVYEQTDSSSCGATECR